MWPWEHLAVGYVLYSVWCRLAWKRPPTARATLVVAVASLFPDLVDKPLAWWLGVLPGGKSFAHSLLVFLPLVVLAFALGARVRSQRSSLAFVVGYASHLAGDVVYPLALRSELRVEFLLWPLTDVGGGQERVLPHVQELFVAFVAFLGTPRGTTYLVAELALVGGAVALWLYDGAPVLGAFWRRDGDASEA